MSSSGPKVRAKSKRSRSTMLKPKRNRARQIVVKRRTTGSSDPGHAFEASLPGVMERGLGATPEEALGRLVMYHCEALGLEVVVEE